jgi:hypothetical protein
MQQLYTQPSTAANLGQPFLELLPVSGVGISVFNRGGQPSDIYASDDTAATLQELQFDLGEGPTFDAFTSVKPVLVPDVFAIPANEWPLFGDGVKATKASAIFVFPLVMGAACIGVAELHRTTVGTLGSANVSTGIALARSIAAPALGRAAAMAKKSSASFGAPEERVVELRREVHQATGMVLAQLNIGATEAFARLRAHAFSSDRSMSDVARSVVTGQLDFGALPD